MKLYSHTSSANTNLLCEQYLAQLYHQVYGHGVSARQNKNIVETYGEILFPSVNRLLAEANLTSEDVFIDLGSGLGKVVLQVFLKSQVRKSLGIEIIPELHAKALQASKSVQQDLPGFYVGNRELHFLLGSFLAIPLHQASVVLIGSPCYSPTLLSQLGTIINRLANIRLVLSLRPIGNLKHLVFTKTLRLEGSWDTTLCYIYRTTTR